MRDVHFKKDIVTFLNSDDVRQEI